MLSNCFLTECCISKWISSHFLILSYIFFLMDFHSLDRNSIHSWKMCNQTYFPLILWFKTKFIQKCRCLESVCDSFSGSTINKISPYYVYIQGVSVQFSHHRLVRSRGVQKHMSIMRIHWHQFIGIAAFTHIKFGSISMCVKWLFCIRSFMNWNAIISL